MIGIIRIVIISFQLLLFTATNDAFSPVHVAVVHPIGGIRNNGINSRTSSSSLVSLDVVRKKDMLNKEYLSYPEGSRPYRRDVFTYNDWIKHRSRGTIINRIKKTFASGVVRSLLKELLLITTVATLTCIFNALFSTTGYVDFNGIRRPPLIKVGLPILQIPMTFFTITSPALSLLLVFKTNTSYQRWDEARKNWGSIINHSRTIMRQGCAWIHDSSLNNNMSTQDKIRLLSRLAAAVWSFPRSMTRHTLSAIEDENDYRSDVRMNLRQDLAEELIAARHRPTRALYEISTTINEFPITDYRRIAMDSAVSYLCDAMGSNERIFTSPVPRFYTRHTSRFLEVWLLLMPLTLYNAFDYTWNHWAMIPATIVISFFLLGIEELGMQLEEPFSLLPQHKMTNGIGISTEEHLDWYINDNIKYDNKEVNSFNAALGKVTSDNVGEYIKTNKY